MRHRPSIATTAVSLLNRLLDEQNMRRHQAWFTRAENESHAAFHASLYVSHHVAASFYARTMHAVASVVKKWQPRNHLTSAAKVGVRLPMRVKKSQIICT